MTAIEPLSVTTHAYDPILEEIDRGVPMVVVEAAPGGGKTELIPYIIAAALRRKQRVLVVTSNYRQLVNVVNRLYVRFPKIVSACWRSGGSKAIVECARLPVSCTATSSAPFASRMANDGMPIFAVVGKATHGRLASGGGDEVHFDLLVIDEAWQVNRANFDVLSGLADQFVLVGDRGQIQPVSVAQDIRWTGDPTGPQVSAPDAILAMGFGPETVSTVSLGRSYRLPHASAQVVSDAFYTASPFVGVDDSQRIFEFSSSNVTSEGAALRRATRDRPPAFVPVVVDGAPGIECAKNALQAVENLVRLLISGDASYRIRNSDGSWLQEVVRGHDIVVLVSRNAERRAIRRSLVDVEGLTISTADSFQGDERPISIVLHPVVGRLEPSTFDLDPGRLCVVLSRHQVACFVILDRHVQGALEDVSSEAFVRSGVVDRTYEGWRCHRVLCDVLFSSGDSIVDSTV